MRFEEALIVIASDDSISVSASWFERGRGDVPYFGKQTNARVMEIHDKVKKFSSYAATWVECESIDWYDSVNEFEVPGFIIKKGSRRKEAEDNSWSTNSEPKSWEVRFQIQFKPAKQKTKQIIESLKALGIVTKFSEAEIKKLVRGKGGRELFKEI